MYRQIGDVHLKPFLAFFLFRMHNLDDPLCCPFCFLQLSVNYDVQSFSFQNQDGKAVTLESLKGQVWVADFIFTNCETICPPMTSHMAELQKQMEEENLQARIVSFSVDPENDTPEKLKKFAASTSAFTDREASSVFDRDC